jgi:antitoxin VapB
MVYIIWTILFKNQEVAQMDIPDTAQLFMNGRSQAVRLPKLFRFEGTQVHIKKVGNSVVLSPILTDRWGALEEALKAFEFEPGFVIERPSPMPQSQREDMFP